MNYQFTVNCTDKRPEEIWQFIQDGLSHDIIIKSIRGKLPYTINHVTKHEISFLAPTRNEGEAEVIGLDDFTAIINRLAGHQYFNTSSAKELFKGTKIYRKRSPFFALLLSANVIERV